MSRRQNMRLRMVRMAIHDPARVSNSFTEEKPSIAIFIVMTINGQALKLEDLTKPACPSISPPQKRQQDSLKKDFFMLASRLCSA